MCRARTIDAEVVDVEGVELGKLLACYSDQLEIGGYRLLGVARALEAPAQVEQGVP